MAKLITILSNVWNEPQTTVYQMMFQQSENAKNKPCSSKNVGNNITDTKSKNNCFETFSSNESTKVLYTIPSIQSKSVQAGSGLKKYRNANIQCGVPHNKLENKSVHFIFTQDKLDCKVGPSLVNFKNDAQSNPRQYKICEAHQDVFHILTNWPRRVEILRLRKKKSKSYYDCVKTCLVTIGKAFNIEKINLTTHCPPEQQIMKLYKCLNIEKVTPEKAKMTSEKENQKRNKGTRPIKTKTTCTYTQTNEVCHAIQGNANTK